MADQARPGSDRRREFSSLQVNNGQGVHCTVCDGILMQLCQPTLHFRFDVGLKEWREGSKKARQKHVRRFLTMVNTLYNEGGGFVLMHGEQQYLAFFDEQVDDRLLDLIPDGSMPDENFRRRRIDDRHTSFQVIPPSPPRLSVLDFHSTISLNKGRTKPTYAHMKHLLTRTHQARDPDPDPLPSSPFGDTRLVKDHVHPSFAENRHLQAKLATDDDLERSKGSSRGEKLFNLCWNNLNIAEFISAFSKLRQGGSYCLGLQEEKVHQGHVWLPLEGSEAARELLGSERRLWKDKENPDVLHLARDEDAPSYENRTGRYIVRGVRLPSPEDRGRFGSLLTAKLRSAMLWFPTQGGSQGRSPPVACAFHPVLELEVAQEEEEEEGQGAAEERAGEERPREGRLVHGDLVHRDLVHRDVGRGDPGRGDLVGRGWDPGTRGLVHRGLYVVEVRVAYYPGVCFQDKEGPEAFRYLHRRRPAAGDPVRVLAARCCRELRV